VGEYEARLDAPSKEGTWIVNLTAKGQRLFRDSQYALATVKPAPDSTAVTFIGLCSLSSLTHFLG